MKYLLFLTLFFASIKASSTCVYIFMTDTAFYVAADSRRVLTSYSKDNQQFDTVMSICKVHKIRNVYFTYAGFDDDKIREMATWSLKKGLNISSTVNLYIDTMKIHYRQLLEMLRVYSPDKFNSLKKAGIASTTFFGFVNGKPFLRNIGFSVKEVGKQIIIEVRRDDDMKLTILGENDHYNQNLGNEIFSSKDPLKMAEQYVRLEIEYHPEKVGEPIDLYIITPKRVIQKTKKGCRL